VNRRRDRTGRIPAPREGRPSSFALCSQESGTAREERKSNPRSESGKTPIRGSSEREIVRPPAPRLIPRRTPCGVPPLSRRNAGRSTPGKESSLAPARPDIHSMDPGPRARTRARARITVSCEDRRSLASGATRSGSHGYRDRRPTKAPKAVSLRTKSTRRSSGRAAFGRGNSLALGTRRRAARSPSDGPSHRVCLSPARSTGTQP
jgi:hypothetical protein